MKLNIVDSDGQTVLRERLVDTGDFTDNAWQSFIFSPIHDSSNRPLHFMVESTGDGEAVTLWINEKVDGEYQRDGEIRKGSICFRCVYSDDPATLLDPLLFRYRADVPSVGCEVRDKLVAILRHCVQTKGQYFARLAHLADAFGRTDGACRVLSVGCGQAYQEAFLAGRVPDLYVHATDLCEPANVFGLPNLKLGALDILDAAEQADYDLVMSIECLEHIEPYEVAFANMAAKVRPGGYLYVSVPFASPEEQSDDALRRKEWDEHQHYTPGFSFDDLRALNQSNGLDVIHAASMFRRDVMSRVNGLLDMMESSGIDRCLSEIGRLFLLHVSDEQLHSRREAVGVRVLARKRASGD